MEQYKAYLEQTYEGESCYIDPQNRGWASYKISGPECYIVHCYLAPEFRGQTLMSEICSHIEKIAVEKGCVYMAGTVDVTARNPERSLKMMIADGYKLWNADKGIITLTKRLDAKDWY